MTADGCQIDFDPENDTPSTSWIDYQTRLVTQSMTATDMYYQPYNVHEAWGGWGARVLEQLECSEWGEKHEECFEDEDDDGDEEDDVRGELRHLRKNPHLVWE